VISIIARPVVFPPGFRRALYGVAGAVLDAAASSVEDTVDAARLSFRALAGIAHW
jgi:hypothetical protein